jgi:hypothetical protein
MVCDGRQTPKSIIGNVLNPFPFHDTIYKIRFWLENNFILF